MMNKFNFWKFLEFVSPKFALDDSGRSNWMTIQILIWCFVLVALLVLIFAHYEYYYEFYFGQ